MTESKNLSKPRWENCKFLWLITSFSGRTKQIFFLIIKLEPWLLSWLQPSKNNFVPKEWDVSVSAIEFDNIFITHLSSLQRSNDSNVSAHLVQTDMAM